MPGSTKTLPGLQLYVNSIPLARVAVPAPAQAAVKAILDPVEVMVSEMVSSHLICISHTCNIYRHDKSPGIGAQPKYLGYV